MAGCEPVSGGDQDLPIHDFAVDPAHLPVPADLLGVRSGGAEAIWAAQRRVAGGEKDRQVPPVGRIRVRSGAITVEN